MNADEYERIYNYLKTGEIPSSIKGSHGRFGFKRKCKTYMLEDERVYYISKNKDGSLKRKALCLVGTDNSKAAFLEVHDQAAQIHPGLNRTLQAISKKYFWPRMTYDVNDWIRECGVCQSAKDCDKSKQWKLTQLKVTEPWEFLAMDIIGPVNETPEGYRFIFTARDFYSKWVEAFPICNKFPAEVAACLKLIFYRHGACKSIVSDEHVDFISEVNAELSKQVGIEHHVRAVYHPDVKTFDEKEAKELKGIFLDLVEDHSFDWPHYIDGLLFSLRTKKNQATKFTPFFLMHKREARMPPIPSTDPVAAVDCNFNLSTVVAPSYDSAARNKSSSSKVHQKVVDNIKGTQDNQMLENAVNLSKTPEPAFNVGDKVLLASTSRKRLYDDFNAKIGYSGPYVISELNNDKVKLLTLNDFTQVKALHTVDKLVPYRESFKLTMFE